ncbi:uncharacterized protein LOC114932445 [Nylanderia fulva]|uniref:uncharacterized protein LOC114932445 n=1 Tax=Nylanderia fulva TaxID=613905 RepID=UPI0010FAF6EB|nr:uncharacterized protein LOC114932445 [Nylanderia fulva]
MKDLYVFAIALSACWTVISAEEWKLGCPVTVCKYPEKYATNLPHETDCTKFYKCSWGRPVLMQCPYSGVPFLTMGGSKNRLHYNRRLQVCDWPWDAGCESCPKNYKKDKCIPPNPKISNPDDSNNKSYYECVNGKPKPKKCAKNKRFSRTCQECVKNPKGGICDNRNRKCEDGEVKAHECDCTKYYECENDEWIERTCKKGRFDPKRRNA